MIYVFFAPGFEETEALTPVDILRRAEQSVKMVGIGAKTITGAHGISINCDLCDFEATQEGLEMLVLPGGMPGTLNLEKSEIVQSLIDFAVKEDKWVAAICAAPSILGHKGLLCGRNAICFPGYEDQLQGACLSKESVCVDGRFITAKGMGVTVDFSLKLVELLTSPDRAGLLKTSLQCDV